MGIRPLLFIQILAIFFHSLDAAYCCHHESFEQKESLNKHFQGIKDSFGVVKKHQQQNDQDDEEEGESNFCRHLATVFHFGPFDKGLSPEIVIAQVKTLSYHYIYKQLYLLNIFRPPIVFHS